MSNVVLKLLKKEDIPDLESPENMEKNIKKEIETIKNEKLSIEKN